MESFPYITLPRRKYCAKKVQLRFFAEMPNFAILSISDEKDFAILSIFDKKKFCESKKMVSLHCGNKKHIAMIFKRKAYDKMLRWKQQRHGQTALLVKGARRVGKSTLVGHFAKNEYKSHIIIDFAHISKKLNALFEDMSDLNYFFMRLQIETGITLYERESVIVFDEVQLQPLARQAIKYLVKDGRYDYIETGSLLSIKKNVQDIVIPSEETRLTLYPMDLEEFYWALGNEATFGILHQFWEMKHPLEGSHRKLMRDLRLYMLVGGMPQAVNTYLETNNLQMVDETKREIIELYKDDFNKIDSTGRASQLFADIPAQLNGNANRYHVSSVMEHQRAPRVATLVSDMADSMTVMIARHVNDPNVGMPMTQNIYHYKMFVADTGLFVTLAFHDKAFTENTIYSRLLSDKLEANLGYVYENLVAQMLRSSGNELFYHTFPASGNHNYEIDFLLSRGNKLCPIEVKSSGYKTHKSLDEFCKKYASRIGERFLVYTKDYAKDGATTCLPVYMTGLL